MENPESGLSLVPQRVGPYDILSVLGEGAMGTVYKAHDPMLDRDVAIKVIAATLAREASFVARFRAEAQTLATVRHEHVVQVYSFGDFEGDYYLAMEFVRGVSLESVVTEFSERDAFMPTESALAILKSLVSALTAVHRVGVVHGDVKPANIVIEEGTRRPVMIDFGIARRVSVPGSTDEVCATPAYMAPELSSGGDQPSELSDQYALACSAFEMLAGRLPFDADTLADLAKAHEITPPPRLSSVRPQLHALDAVLARALAKRPSERYPNCAAFGLALERAKPAPLSSKQLAAAIRTPVPGNRRRVLVVGAVEAMAEPIAVAIGQLRLHADVSFARTAREALETFEDRPAAMVVTLLSLPDLDGTELLALLRRMPHGAQFRAAYVGAPDERSSARLTRLAVHTMIPATATTEIVMATLLDLLAKG